MQLILYTGPGGAGTTTLACATALALVQSGQRVLLAGVEDADDLRDALGPGLQPDGVDLVPTPLSEPVTDWGGAQESLLRVLSRLGLDPALAEEAPLLPGAGPLRVLLRLLELVGGSQADVAVVDLGPLRPAVDLLSLPTRLAWAVQRVIAASPELGSALRALAMVTGARPETLARSMAGLLTRLETLEAGLRREDCRARLVLPVGSHADRQVTRRIPDLAVAGIRVDLLVRNRTVEVREVDTAAETLSDRLGLEGVEVLHVPDCGPGSGSAPVGETDQSAADAGLEVPARRIAHLVPKLASTRLPSVSLAPRVDLVGGRWQLALPVPQAGGDDPDQVRVQRRGDDLLITVRRRRLLVPLTGALRRCRVRGADHADGRLIVHFDPLEDWWPRQDGAS